MVWDKSSTCPQDTTTEHFRVNTDYISLYCKKCACNYSVLCNTHVTQASIPATDLYITVQLTKITITNCINNNFIIIATSSNHLIIAAKTLIIVITSTNKIEQNKIYTATRKWYLPISSFMLINPNLRVWSFVNQNNTYLNSKSNQQTRFFKWNQDTLTPPPKKKQY